MDKRFESLTKRIDRFMIWSFGLTISVGGLVVAAIKLLPRFAFFLKKSLKKPVYCSFGAVVNLKTRGH